MTTTTETTTVTKPPLSYYMAALAPLVTTLEAHPELIYSIVIGQDGAEIRVDFWHNTAAADMAAAARLFPTVFTKNNPTEGYGYNSTYYILTGQVNGVKITLTAYRNDVCKRVVTHVEHVVEELPDPELVAALPTIKVEREVETVEWQCVPLLREADGGK